MKMKMKMKMKWMEMNKKMNRNEQENENGNKYGNQYGHKTLKTTYRHESITIQSSSETRNKAYGDSQSYIPLA